MGGAGASAAAPSLVDTLFQRSLDDVIKSLRANPGGEPAQIARALDEIRREARSGDPDTKSAALQKLSYLSSLHGQDPSFAAFHSLELLPSPSLAHKRSAYFAAALSLPLAPDLLLLSTNQLRKDLSSPDPLPSLALHFFSLAATPDLARDLSPDLSLLLSSPRPALRRKAVAAALTLLLRHPDSAHLALRRLVDALAPSSTDPRLVSAAVGLFCELSARNPAAYLPLAPDLFRVLADSPRNNWVLIKVLKIFARLAPLEPRLARRILDPVCDLARKSPAKSLALECVRTIATALSDFDHAVRLAVDRVREFLAAEDDPNLRYLGLHALSLLGPKHSWVVEENREAIVKSLSDPDPNIRRQSLQLIMGMVFESNVIEISLLLLSYAKKSDPEFCNEILGAVLTTCGRNVYELIMDFDWYTSLLGDMARIPHCAKGEEIERQLVDIGLRVKDARPELVHVARELLIDPALLGNPLMFRILCAAAWVSGEYAEFSRNPVELVEALLQPRTNLPPSPVRAVYIQAVFKVLSFCFSSYVEHLEVSLLCSSDAMIGVESGDGGTDEQTTGIDSSEKKKNRFTSDSITYILNLIETTLGPLSECDEVEVQERSRNVLGFVQILKEIGVHNSEEGLLKDSRVGEVVKLLQDVFSEELGPVAANGQDRVPLPEGLFLEENLAGLAAVLGEDDIASISFSLRTHHHTEDKEGSTPSIESASFLAEHRKRHGLYYLPTKKDETDPDDYPLANEPQLPISNCDSTEDLVKLTKQSLTARKAKQTRPRPVVVKLDEGDGMPPTSTSKPVKDSQVDLLSGAVRDVLLGNEGAPTSSDKNYPDISRRGSKDKSVASEPFFQSNENPTSVDKKHGSSSRSRHHRHGKERHKSPQKSDDKEEADRNSLKTSSRHGKHKHKQRGDTPLNVVPQTPVIQDFLL